MRPTSSLLQEDFSHPNGLIVPFIDNIEWLTTAIALCDQDVIFVVLRDETNVKKYDRFVRSSVVIQEAFKANGGKAEFFYANVEQEISELSRKVKTEVINGAVLDAIHKSMSLATKRPVVVSYSISDYYLCSYMFRGNYSPMRERSKDEVYTLAFNIGVPQDLRNEYRQLDLERIFGAGVTHKDIEWAHDEMRDSARAWDFLDDDYSEVQREHLQFVRRNRYVNSKGWTDGR